MQQTRRMYCKDEHRYLFLMRVSGTTFIMYAKNQKMGKPNKSKVPENKKTKGV
jgi:hypothetical protein